MDQSQPPLFNRTYLKILPWIVAITIVLLTANSQNSTSDLYETIEADWLYLSIDKESTHNQIKLAYPISLAITEPQTQQRIALQSALKLAINARQGITAQWHDDKLVLTLPLPVNNVNEASVSLSTQLDELTALISSHYPQALQRASAERYLALNSIDELALSNFKAQLPTSSVLSESTDIYNLFSQSPTVLLVLKKNNSSLVKIISEQLKTRYPVSAKQNAFTSPQTAASKINVRHRGPSHLYLIGQAITPDTNNISRTLAFHYINKALQPLMDKNQSSYRLILKPAFPVGYAALSIRRNSAFNETAIINNLQTYLQERFNDEQLEQIKTDLANQYDEQLASAERRADILSIKLFSGEKFQSTDEFRDTLAEIQIAQIQTHIHQLFDPAHAIIVHITPP